MPGHHSRSPSPRRRHSRSPSPGHRRHSRSPSPGHRRPSHSPGHRRPSRSPSPGRHHHKHSPPPSPGRHGGRRHEETESQTQKYESTSTKPTYSEPVAATTSAFAATTISQPSMSQSQPTQAAAEKKQMTWTKSKKFGGDGGDAFDHGNFENIAKISVKHDGHAVHSIAATYPGGKRIASGKDDGDIVELNLNQGEYVNKVTVRSNRLIQCLTFETNKGRKLGPAGGEGWRLVKDRKGEEETITAPQGYKLCGFSGSAGDYIDSIVFNWGTI
jgi:Jacalin-like lectin domain